MSTLLTARQVCEQALRKVGSYSINDTGADPDEMREALSWLDLIMAELAGTNNRLFLRPDTVEIPMVNDQRAYSLDIAGLEQGVSYPVKATLHYGGSFLGDIQIATRGEYEVLRQTDVGHPQFIYIDRLNTPVMHVHPTPQSGLLPGHSIRLVVQTLGPDVIPRGAGHALGNASATGLRHAWQRWAIYRLASDLGDGTIRTLPGNKLRTFEAKAGEALAMLQAHEDREHSTPTRAKPWGL